MSLLALLIPGCSGVGGRGEAVSTVATEASTLVTTASSPAKLFTRAPGPGISVNAELLELGREGSLKVSFAGLRTTKLVVAPEPLKRDGLQVVRAGPEWVIGYVAGNAELVRWRSNGIVVDSMPPVENWVVLVNPQLHDASTQSWTGGAIESVDSAAQVIASAAVERPLSPLDDPNVSKPRTP